MSSNKYKYFKTSAKKKDTENLFNNQKSSLKDSIRGSLKRSRNMMIDSRRNLFADNPQRKLLRKGSITTIITKIIII